MNTLLANTITKNSLVYSDNNIETLHIIKMNSDETMFQFLSKQLNESYYSQKEKDILRDILTIPKKTRYINMAKEFIPDPVKLSESQIQRIVTCVKEGYLLAQTIQKSFGEIKIISNSSEYGNVKNKKIKYHENHLVLAGGSVRDILFLQESELKDLDFCFAFTQNPSFSGKNHLHPTTIFKLIDDGVITNEHRQDPQYQTILNKLKEYTDTIRTQSYIQNILNSFEFSFFIRYHLSKNGAISDAVYVGLHDEALLNNLGWEEYINDDLSATIKTFGKSSIPIDILIGSACNTNTINSFDFCLCKSFVCFENILKDFKEEPANEQECIKYFYSNLNVPMSVLRDIKAKEFSISKKYQNDINKIEFFIGKHYPRLLKKYPGFQINIEGVIGSKEAVENKSNIIKKLSIEQIFNYQNAPSWIEPDEIDEIFFKI